MSNMTRAYGDGTLTSLVRRFTLAEDGGIELADRYAFSRKPRSVEEAFITYEPVRIARGGRSAAIGRGRRTCTLSAPGTAGRFAAERLVEASKEGRTDGVVTRITFTPKTLQRDMTLTFAIR